MKKQKIYFYKGQIIFIFLGVIWCFVCYRYLCLSGWWQNKNTLSPMEFVGGLGGLAFPLLILFLVSAYFDRNVFLEKQTKKVRAMMEELLYPTEEGATPTKELVEDLRQQIIEFRSVYSGINQHTDKVRDNLQRWIEGLNKLVQTVDTQTVASIQKMADHIQKLAEITHQSNQQARETTTLLAGQADMVHSVSREAKEQLSEIRQNLMHEAEHLQKIMAYFEEARLQIGQKMGTCEKMAEVMTKNTLKLGQTLEGYSDLKTLSEDTQKMQRQMAGLGENLEQRAQHLKNILSQLNGDMTLVSQGLQAHTRALESHLNMKQAQKQDFLKQASTLTKQLQQFSVDLAHLFAPKNEEALWQKYYAGDKTVFMRYLAKELKSSQQHKIRQLYLQNIAFQTAVLQYMKAFEQMTAEATENVSDSPLLAVLIGSDVGRLYMVLTQIIKGEEK